MYLAHLRELEAGHLETLSNCGRYTRDHIRLDRRDLLSWRLLRREVAEDLQRFEMAKARLREVLSLTTDPTERNRIQAEIATIESTTLRLRYEFGL